MSKLKWINIWRSGTWVCLLVCSPCGHFRNLGFGLDLCLGSVRCFETPITKVYNFKSLTPSQSSQSKLAEVVVLIMSHKVKQRPHWHKNRCCCLIFIVDVYSKYIDFKCLTMSSLCKGCWWSRLPVRLISFARSSSMKNLYGIHLYQKYLKG